MMLQKEEKDIDKKYRQAKTMSMDKAVITTLEDALAIKEMQVEVKEAKLDRLNNLLQ